MRIYVSICLYFVVSLQSYSHCCDCDKRKRENYNKIKKYSISELLANELDSNDNAAVDKQKPDYEEDIQMSTENFKSATIEATDKEELLTNPDTNTNEIKLTRKNEYTAQLGEEHIRDGLNERCPYFKNGREFDLTEMADVWEIVYYQMPYKLTCFKIFLKITTHQEREYYEKLYGSFEDRVNWKNCVIQIRASHKKNDTTKHFLQGAKKNKGLFENIILKEETDGRKSDLTFHTENPDQWLLVKDLLLMRDCMEGWVIIFARVPYQPRWMDIQDALSLFGEEKINGHFGCEEYSNRP